MREVKQGIGTFEKRCRPRRLRCLRSLTWWTRGTKDCDDEGRAELVPFGGRGSGHEQGVMMLWRTTLSAGLEVVAAEERR